MGGNHGRDGEMTEKEEEAEKGRSSRALTGQHTCRSGPRISACARFHHLDGSDLHRTSRKEIEGIRNSFPRDVRSLITAWLVLIQRADVSHIWARSWKMNSFSLKQQKSFLLPLPSFCSKWQVLDVFFLSSVLRSGSDSSSVSRPVSPQSQCV